MRTSRDALRRRLAELVFEACDREVPVERIAASAEPLYTLGIGSLAMLRLVDAVEDEFGFFVDAEEFFSAVGDLDSLTDWLSGRLAATAS
jgi:acyl carrier protein